MPSFSYIVPLNEVNIFLFYLLYLCYRFTKILNDNIIVVHIKNIKRTIFTQRLTVKISVMGLIPLEEINYFQPTQQAIVKKLEYLKS